MRILLVFITLVFFISCATQVTSIKQDQDRELEANIGYVLLGIQTNRSLKTIYIDGPQKIHLSSMDLKKGTNYLLVDLQAGVYSIKRVVLNDILMVSLVLNKKDPWNFEIKPDQINYVGHLEVVQRDLLGFYTHLELVNRSSEAIEFLEEKFPTVLANRSLTFGGPGDDHFFQYLASDFME